jgi:hypothetical protein
MDLRNDSLEQLLRAADRVQALKPSLKSQALRAKP